MKILRYPYYTLIFLSFCLFPVSGLFAQNPTVEYGEAEELEIGGVEVTGVFFSDPTAIKSVAGLKVGQIIKIPGTDITKAIRNLWKLRLFDDVSITQDKRVGKIIFLSIHLTERARLANWSYRGVQQGIHDDLNDIVKPFLIKGQVAGTAMQINAKNAIKKYFIGKGFLDVEVKVSEEPTAEHANSVNLIFDIDTKEKVKVANVFFVGNKNVTDYKLQKLVKETKAKRNLLKKSKYVEVDYEADKQHLIDFYHELGFRDAKIVKDSFWRNEGGLLDLQITLDEGQKYYFGNITWKGNTIHDDDALNRILGIRRGEVYNEKLLDTRLAF